MTLARRTVAQVVSFEGRGLHSGEPVRVSVHPGEDGIAFRFGAQRWQAIPENVSDTTRCTRLGEVGTIEHLMSALAGLEITDAEIEIEGSVAEMPALDGSAIGYVRALMEGGFESLAERSYSEPFTRVFLQELPIKIAIGKGEGRWRYEYDTDERWPGRQVAVFAAVTGQYAEEVAPARTFALSEEIPRVLAAGLAKGLDLDSALILGERGYENEPRFPDEPARHKLLDLIGDLYLAGIPIRLLNVVAERSGHRTNVEAAARLRAAVVH